MKMSSNNSTGSSSAKSTDSQEESDDAATTSKEEDDKFNLCPFKLLWSFGMNAKVPLINLTTENRTIIAYACSHVVLMYDYKTKEVKTLQGHKNVVRTLSISKDGKWLLSADFGEDSVVVVWDTETGVPICTLFNTHERAAIAAARISPNAKYIVTVGNENYQKVHFWLWTYGKDKPDAYMELTEIVSDRVKEITFNEDFPEEFALTADQNIIFLIWEHDKLKYNYPKVFSAARRYGAFNCSCYVPKMNQALTATAKGYVLIWNVISEKGNNKVSNGERKHSKSIRLQKNSITVILHHDRMIVTGTTKGRINFYDLQLKILYWCQNCGLDSIQSISFDLQSTLLRPTFSVTTFDDTIDEDDLEYEGEFEEYLESNIENDVCDRKIQYLTKLRTKTLQDQEKVSSTLSVNIEPRVKLRYKNQETVIKPHQVPVDATLENAPFHTNNFFASTVTGTIALIKIATLKCCFISRSVGAAITSLDAHPESKYIVTGNAQGMMCLYEYEKRKIIVCRKSPPFPNLHVLIDSQVKSGNIIYITCPQRYEKLAEITVLKFSPRSDMLMCGLANGTLWILHPITLKPLDKFPYKHSTESILKLIVTEDAEYMAYSDNTFVVAVFKRNHNPVRTFYFWDFVGKYRSHYSTIRDILFEPVTSTSNVPRLFSLGEDQNIVEYDLNNSGPYPHPGLVIFKIYQIEYTATPLCFSWYPEGGVERFLMISNSEYKYRLLNDTTKMIRGTFLGPLFGAPVQHFEILPNKEHKTSRHIIFATDKEIGLQISPFDGNPYKSLGMIGHPSKITNVCVNHDGNILFTSGYNDHCVLMWKIKCRSVDALAQLGGESLSPYYSLIEGGRKGWLIKEMKDLFYYAQILHQGENTTATRIVSDKVATKQIPNLMRAIGYYPSNEEIEVLMGEISYRNYAKTGQLIEEITFEDFVKLYINHRPPFGISLHQLREGFQAFTNSKSHPFLVDENPVLSREQFMNILFGNGPEELLEKNNEVFGEPLTRQEAYIYLKFLTGSANNLNEMSYQDFEKRSMLIDFTFLPERISYKDFTANIMGIELSEKTRADDE